MIERSEIMKHVHQIKISSRYTPRRPASCRPTARPQRPEKQQQTVAEGREHKEMRYKMNRKEVGTFPKPLLVVVLLNENTHV